MNPSHVFSFCRCLHRGDSDIDNLATAVDWRQATDHLRCSPQFHGHVRRDFVIIQTNDNRPLFAQLLFLFKCRAVNTEYSLALILPFDQHIPIRERPKIEERYRLGRARPRKSAEFIFTKSIIRGALLVNSFL